MSDKDKNEVENISSTSQLASSPFIDIDAYAPKMMANRGWTGGSSKS